MGSYLFKMGLNGPKWMKMGQNGLKSVKMGSNQSIWDQISLNGPLDNKCIKLVHYGRLLRKITHHLWKKTNSRNRIDTPEGGRLFDPQEDNYMDSLHITNGHMDNMSDNDN